MAFDSHVGVLAFPFGNHPAPLFSLTRRLAAATRGTLFSFFNSPASNATLFKEPQNHNNIRPHDVWDGTPENEVFTGSHFEAVGLFLKASPSNFEKAIEEAEKGSGLKISCLITDGFLWFGSDMAGARGVPWVTFWASAASTLSAHVYMDEIVKAVAKTEQELRLSFIPGLENACLSDLPPEIFLDKNPSPIALAIANMVQNLPKSTAIVLNSFDVIDPAATDNLRRKFRHVLIVGPPVLLSPAHPPSLDEDRTGCLPWLEQFRSRPGSVIYIGFGTVVVPPEPELAALAEALDVLRAPFLWSLNDRAKSLLPGWFAERTGGFGRVVPWAPQARVLRHESVGVFVSHCGWNSVIESIAGRVPMVCRPFFGDQRMNGMMVEQKWRIGVRVRGGVFGRTETAEALERVMSDDGMKENVGRLSERVMEAVGPGGSSSRYFEELVGIIRHGRQN